MLYRACFPRLLRRLALGVLWLAMLALAACGTTLPTIEPVELTIAASSSAQPLAQQLATAYHAANNHITVHVLPLANEAAAQQAVLDGRADAALVAGPLADSPLHAHPLAVDGLAVVINPARPLENITPGQITDIFRGQVRAWADLGVGDGDIQVVTREADAAPRRVLTTVFLGARQLTPTARVAPDDATVRAQVAADSNAIAVLPLSWVDSSVRAVPIDGRGPEWVAHGWPDYPARLPLTLFTSATPSADLAALLSWLASPPGQTVISRQYALAGAAP